MEKLTKRDIERLKKLKIDEYQKVNYKTNEEYLLFRKQTFELFSGTIVREVFCRKLFQNYIQSPKNLYFETKYYEGGLR